MKLTLFLLILVAFLSCKKSASGPEDEELTALWIKTDGIDSLTVNCIIKHNDNLFAGTTNGGVFLSDNGANWYPSNTGLTDTSVRAMATNGNFIFVGTDKHGVFRSNNNGLTWEISNNGIGNIRIYCLSAIGNYIFAGSLNRGLFRSTDQGLTWQRLENGIPISSIRSITKCDSGIFVGTMDAGIYRSTDLGASWNSLSIPNTNGWISSIYIDGSTIIASTDGSNSNVYLSTDLGTYWQESDSGLHSSVVCAFAANQGVIYAGTYWGFYFSTDNGVSWNEASQGLPDKTIYALYVESPFVYAGGAVKGIWRRELSQIVPDK
jgi:photosystem II stability/assembly factor-like uncharacterized protein